jgi:hypothetical protein
MLLELGRLATFILCILSLYSVMFAAIFVPGARWQDRLFLALCRVAIAAILCFASGALFQRPAKSTTASASAPAPAQSIFSTLPVRLFLWALAAMAALFLLTWFLDTCFLPLYNKSY